MQIIKTALRFILFDKSKSIGVTVGIFISTFLIGQQLGILNFLTGLMITTATNANAEVWVVNIGTSDLNQLGTMDVRKVNELLSVEGVKEAYPIVLSGGNAVYENGTSAGLLLIGSEGPYFPAGPTAENIRMGRLVDLQRDQVISAEYFDSASLGGTTDPGTTLEINGKRAVVGLQTRGVRGFGAPIAYTSLEKARFYGNIPPTKINAVLVNCIKGVSSEKVVENINRILTGVKAWRSEDLEKSTIATVLGSSGIAASTGSLIVFALISGFFIIGLTLYSSALDRLRDYGTLKAIGAKHSYLRKLVLAQALTFAIVGFFLGYLLLEGFRLGVAKTGLIFNLSPMILAVMFFAIVLLALGSASFALRKIKGVEPASVFR